MGCASSTPEALQDKDEVPSPEGVNMREIDVDEVKAKRLSVSYQSQEVDGPADSGGVLDRSIIGTHTKHGMMPAMRGGGAAKINQDRGVICFPFHGSFDEALLCVFDGHGPKGEKASEFCMKTLPQLLEYARAPLPAPRANAPHHLPCRFTTTAPTGCGDGDRAYAFLDPSITSFP